MCNPPAKTGQWTEMSKSTFWFSRYLSLTEKSSYPSSHSMASVVVLGFHGHNSLPELLYNYISLKGIHLYFPVFHMVHVSSYVYLLSQILSRSSKFCVQNLTIFVHPSWKLFSLNALSYLFVPLDLNLVSVSIRQVLLQLLCGGVHDFASVILCHIF